MCQLSRCEHKRPRPQTRQFAEAMTVLLGVGDKRLLVCKFPLRHRLPTPVFLGLPLHRGRVRVLALNPVRRATRTIRRVTPLRHDAFQSELACVRKDRRAVAVQMLGKPNPIPAGEQRFELALAPLETPSPPGEESAACENQTGKPGANVGYGHRSYRCKVQHQLLIAISTGAAKDLTKILGGSNGKEATTDCIVEISNG